MGLGTLAVVVAALCAKRSAVEYANGRCAIEVRFTPTGASLCWVQP